MRIGIVNHLVPNDLQHILASESNYEIAWVARDSTEAVNKCLHDTPDLVLMDLNMPAREGVQATQRIMKDAPCPILVVTAAVGENTAQIFEAMGYGALDVVETPLIGNDNHAKRSRELFFKKIKTIAKLQDSPRVPNLRPATQLPINSFPSRQTRMTQVNSFPSLQTRMTPAIPHLIAIGSSTGGPKALVKLLAGLPTSLPAVIIIIQHVNQEFSANLADWLSSQSPLPVRLALTGKRPEIGTVYLASTNDHLVLTERLTFAYTLEPRSVPYRPSVDVFFQSIAKYWRRKGVAVLLTGMGRDGAEGLVLLRKTGWYTIAQDEASSVVYGMPKAAKERDAAMNILPIDKIAQAISHFFNLNYRRDTYYLKRAQTIDSHSQ